ncbi:MAG: hypothetical protein IT560_15370 [Alphaproteobacteria bacterium]|nr:hypothetical protein [Alphaproteobacteria bacterium]
MNPGLSSKLPKVFTMGDSDDLIITAFAPVEGAEGGWRQIAFKAQQVDYVFQIDSEISGMTLKNGVTIPVVMGFERLRQTVYQPDMSTGNGIDLTLITGNAVRDVQAVRLSKKFNPAAEGEAEPEIKKRPFVNKPLKIAVFVRQHEQQNFQMFFVSDDRIDWARVEGVEQGKNGKATKLALLYDKGPFGETSILIDMPRPAFMEIYNKAKMEGATELDLREWTRRRDPDKTPPPPKLPSA